MNYGLALLYGHVDLVMVSNAHLRHNVFGTVQVHVYTSPNVMMTP